MDDIFEITLLFDFYGSLLTEKQREIFDMYYNMDFSLKEISDELNISRQTVFDTIKRSKSNLYSFEENLSLVKRHLKIKNDVKSAVEFIDTILNSFDKDSENYNKLLETRNLLENIE